MVRRTQGDKRIRRLCNIKKIAGEDARVPCNVRQECRTS